MTVVSIFPGMTLRPRRRRPAAGEPDGTADSRAAVAARGTVRARARGAAGARGWGRGSDYGLSPRARVPPRTGCGRTVVRCARLPASSRSIPASRPAAPSRGGRRPARARPPKPRARRRRIIRRRFPIRDASDVGVKSCNYIIRPCSRATGKGGAARSSGGMRLRCARVTARRSHHFPVSQDRPVSAALASACQGRAVGGSPPRRARPWMRPRSRAL